MKGLEISVVMPTFNRVNGLQKVLDALMNQSLQKDRYEVIVVNNRSTDGTKDFLKVFCREHPSVRYVYEGKQGAAAARNKGVSEVSADIVLFLDDDMVVDPGLLEAHVEAHCDFEGSVLGYFITGWEGKDDLFLQYLEKSGTQNCFPFKDGDEVGYRYFYTGNVSVRKSVFEKVDCFDEGFSVYGIEDIDLGYRLEQFGEKMMFCKSATSLHDYHPTFESYCQKQRLLGQSFRHFFIKFPGLKSEFRFVHYPFVFFFLMKWFFVLLHPIALLFRKRLNFLWYGYFHWMLRYEKKKGYMFWD